MPFPRAVLLFKKVTVGIAGVVVDEVIRQCILLIRSRM